MAEKEYIELNEAVKACEDYFKDVCVYDVASYEAVDDFERILNSIPVVDVAPVKHGHWEYDKHFRFAECSECEAEFYICDLEEISGDGFINFCPN